MNRSLSLVFVLGALAASSSASAQAPAPGARPHVGATLSLRDAIQRGLQFNLGTLNVQELVERARGQRTIARSALLPNLLGDLTIQAQQLNLAAIGFGFNLGNALPGVSIPTVVGPFQTVDIRARVTQNVLDLSSWRSFRSARESTRAAELSADDARDVVVMAVGGAYLQALAARARVASARAQLETANALYDQTRQRRNVGLVAQVDVDRSQIQQLTQQQRLTMLQAELSKEKIDLLQMIGFKPTDDYELSDDVPFAPPPVLAAEDAVRQARDGRSDVKAAEAQVRAAEATLAAAHAERLPSVSVNADYGAIGASFGEVARTFSVAGRVRVPLWQGGRAAGDITQAESTVAQRKTELDDLMSHVEGDVRKAMLDLQAAGTQVDVAQRNVAVSREALDLTRQRFEAGVSDNVEVVQAQESVAAAAFDYINSVFTHNVSKLNLARAMGQSAERLADFLKLP